VLPWYWAFDTNLLAVYSQLLWLKRVSVSRESVMLIDFKPPDIPACQYVIRFDALTSLTQYIQSRGRGRAPVTIRYFTVLTLLARKTNSFYITLMAARDTKLLAEYKHIKERDVIARTFCQSLPEDRLIKPHQEDYLYTNAHVYGSEDAMTVPPFCAINVVAIFCQTLPSDEFISIKPKCRIESFGARGYRATYVLPPVTEILPISGRILQSEYNTERMRIS
jgi:endoribonuclease Dicer